MAITAPNNGASDNTIQRVQPQRAEMRVVEDNGPLAYLFDTARFEHMQRIAKMLAVATLTPKHLKGQSNEETIANCFRVANQAVRWGVDPFAVCDETYVVHGKLGYQGKLIAAIVNTRAGLEGRLNYSYKGTGDDRTITVSGKFENEEAVRTVDLSVRQAKTDNKMWRDDPDQKLVYSGVTKWARKHCPEVIMGVLTDDDVERMRPEVDMPIRPPTDSLADRLGSVQVSVLDAPKPKAIGEPVTNEHGEPLDDADEVERLRKMTEEKRAASNLPPSAPPADSGSESEQSSPQEPAGASDSQVAGNDDQSQESPPVMPTPCPEAWIRDQMMSRAPTSLAPDAMAAVINGAFKLLPKPWGKMTREGQENFYRRLLTGNWPKWT